MLYKTIEKFCLWSEVPPPLFSDVHQEFSRNKHHYHITKQVTNPLWIYLVSWFVHYLYFQGTRLLYVTGSGDKC